MPDASLELCVNTTGFWMQNRMSYCIFHLFATQFAVDVTDCVD